MMNRPAVGPHSLRGLPNGFPGQQQQMPQNRSVSSRLPPTGKMANNGASWAFGGGIQMGSAGLGNPRPSAGPLASFAQTIGGTSQPTTPLDLSEFPSLSNNQPQSNQQSTWAVAGARSMGQPPMRMQQQPSLTSQQQQLNLQQQQQQDDLFNSSSQLPSNQGGFRFGNQNAVGQSSQPSTADDFPPLNRNVNGDIGQDRASTLMQNAGFGTQSNGLGGFGSGNPPSQPNRNGLLNVLSGSTRAAPGNRVASPGSLSVVSNTRSPVDPGRQGLGSNNESDPLSFSHPQFGSGISPSQNETSSSATIVPRDLPSQNQDIMSARAPPESGITPPQTNVEEPSQDVEDPLGDMSEIDKWGLKGFSFMMRNYPDYASLVTGADLTTLGFDLTTSEPFCDQIYSLFDNEPPRPAVPRYTLPECYTVGNVAPLESKMPNFNDEALIFMFYSNPGDVQQVMAAHELHQRNWRYHKKLRLWLTKDELMVPQPLGNGTERGYYIFFDIKHWHRERREFTLIYEDLENLPNSLPRTM